MPAPHPGREDGELRHMHRVYVPGDPEKAASACIGFGWVDLDPRWSGRGIPQSFIAISRWCPNYNAYQQDFNLMCMPEVVNVLLIESVEGWGEVKRRVQLLTPVDLSK
jgi:hypothetical protein